MYYAILAFYVQGSSLFKIDDSNLCEKLKLCNKHLGAVFCSVHLTINEYSVK